VDIAIIIEPFLFFERMFFCFPPLLLPVVKEVKKKGKRGRVGDR